MKNDSECFQSLGCHTDMNHLICYFLCLCHSVELDFKQQEDKLQPLMKRLCPLDSPQYPALPYSNEVFTSTPKRKSKTESKKHARWKLWFLWGEHYGFGMAFSLGMFITGSPFSKMDERTAQKRIFRREDGPPRGTSKTIRLGSWVKSETVLEVNRGNAKTKTLFSDGS